MSNMNISFFLMQHNPETGYVSSYTTRDEGEEDNLTSGSLTNERGVNMQYRSRVLGTSRSPISRVVPFPNGKCSGGKRVIAA